MFHKPISCHPQLNSKIGLFKSKQEIKAVGVSPQVSIPRAHMHVCVYAFVCVCSHV